MFQAKIGIIGTHSAGKTTLAKEFARFAGVPFKRSDCAREIAEILKPGTLLDELGPEQQWQLQQLFLASAEDVARQDGPFVTDCCSLTCDPYSRKLIGSAVADIAGYDSFIERAHQGIAPLTHICYLPPEIDLVPDGFRPRSPDLRLQLDADLRQQLESYPFWVLTGTVAQRVEQLARITGVPHESMWQRYIAFEGLPSSGKSTQIKALSAYLEARQVAHHVCKRYGSEALKREIASLYVDPSGNRERLLALHLESFHEQHVRNEVQKRLEAGEVVIADRQKFTILALHMALGADVGDLYRATRDLPTPGRVFYLDCLPGVSVARSRRSGKNEHPIKCDSTFQQRVQSAYAWLAAHQYEFESVNANHSVDVVQQVLRRRVMGAHPLTEATERVLAIFRAYPQQGTKPWDVKTAAQDLAYQVGTLNRSLMQLDGYVHAHGMTTDDMRAAIRLDVGDILTLALFVAHEMGMNPDDLFDAQLANDLQKIVSRR